MYMLKTLLSVALFTAAAVAQSTVLAFTSFPPSTVAAGSPVTVTWTGGDSTQPVTITLRKGPQGNLQDVGVLTSSATGGSYTWTPDTTLVDGTDYALEISQTGSSPNYTGQFAVSGGSGTSVAASGTASATKGSSTGASASSGAASSTSSDSSASSAAASSSASSTSSTSSKTSTSASATSTKASSTSTNVPSTGGASGLQSPLALVFGAVAAIMYLH